MTKTYFNLLHYLSLCDILLFLSLFLILSTESFALPSEHQVHGQNTGWVYPLDDNTNGQPIQNITFGFMSYNNSSFPYHYAQDITTDYNEDDPVYALSEGKIIRIRKSGAYGGGSPCNSDYNTLIAEYKYIKDINTNTIDKVYVFYGHIKNILGLPQNATQQELIVEIPIKKGQKIAELNNPSCAGWPVHLHLTVMPDNLPADYYDGYNNTQVKNGRARPFDCSSNTNGIWSKDWVDANGLQNIPSNDEVFFDTYKPYTYVKLPVTGQKKCYDSSGTGINCIGTGQDAEKMAGSGWPYPRFINPANGLIVDNLTGLIWAKDTGTPTVGSCVGGTKTWQDALTYIQCLKFNRYLGYSDWRLPNVNEINSLINVEEPSMASWLHSIGFVNLSSAFYWSSTTYSGDHNTALVYYMGDPYWNYYPKYSKNYVMPVRGNSSGPSIVWKTGQITSYASGDDGDLKQGVSWPSPRFTDNNNGTVSDNLTGLIWTKATDIPGINVNWIAALDYIAKMNSGTKENFGYNDWRLPNIKELESLTDSENYAPALQELHPFTINSFGGQWSSTTVASNPSRAWMYSLYHGISIGNGKLIGGALIWPVRGGDVGVSITNANSSQSYSSLQDAYFGAYNFETLQCENKTINEDIIINRNISLLIEGGYNRDFTSIFGITEITGNVTITDGTVTLNDFIIR